MLFFEAILHLRWTIFLLRRWISIPMAYQDSRAMNATNLSLTIHQSINTTRSDRIYKFHQNMNNLSSVNQVNCSSIQMSLVTLNPTNPDTPVSTPPTTSAKPDSSLDSIQLLVTKPLHSRHHLVLVVVHHNHKPCRLASPPPRAFSPNTQLSL